MHFGYEYCVTSEGLFRDILKVHNMTTLFEETELRVLICDHPVTRFGSSTAEENGLDGFYKFRVTSRNKRSGLEVAVHIRVYNFDEFSAREQQSGGRVINTGDCCVFTARTTTPSEIIFKIDLLGHDGQLIGSCHLPGSDMSGPAEKVYVITAPDGQALSEIKVQTHAVHPWPGLKEYRSLGAQVWRRSGRAQICGHRGMGRTMEEKFSLVEMGTQGSVAHPENTISAFKRAHELGLSAVEMDICVSGDGVPFVFHDFDVDLSIQEESTGVVHSFTTAHLMHMTYQEIKVLRNLQHNKTGLSHSGWKCSFIKDDLPEDYKPFPRLQKVLEDTPQDIAFNVEVKFPMTYVTGVRESYTASADRETVVNNILDVVYKYGGDRKIIFSAFDPDICLLLRLKQHRYPVLIINYGPTEKYDLYAGLRCSSTEIAIAMALSENFKGINGHSNDYVDSPWLLTKMHEHGLILWVWGEDNNNPEHQRKLKKLGVDYITTDRVDAAISLKE